MSQPIRHVPGAGAETTPGEENVTSKTVQPVDPGRTPEEHAADAWTGQYPDGRTRDPRSCCGGDGHVGAAQAADSIAITTGGTSCEGPVVDPDTGEEIQPNPGR